MKHSSIARRGAAAATAAALVLGASAFLAPAADAKPKPLKGRTSGTVLFDCDFAGSPFDYDATIKVSGVRKTKTTKAVALTATMSELPGVAPLALDFDATSKMKVRVGKVKTVLKGKGHLTTDGPSQPAKMFPAKGSAKVKGKSLPITVTAFEIEVLGNTIACTPAEGEGSLGRLKLK